MVGWASSEERVPVEDSSPVVRASARQLAANKKPAFGDSQRYFDWEV
jgi:hypothetical protein